MIDESIKIQKKDMARNQIVTDRLILRNWRLEDAENLYKYASDERVSELALWPRHESIEMSRMVIEKIFLPNRLSFAMILKETGEPVGCIGLVPSGDEHFVPAAEEREVGYWIGYPYWNKGLTTEALEGFTVYCRDCLGLKSLLLTTDTRNVASRHVAEKCGFHFVDEYDFEGISSMAYRIDLQTL